MSLTAGFRGGDASVPNTPLSPRPKSSRTRSGVATAGSASLRASTSNNTLSAAMHGRPPQRSDRGFETATSSTSRSAGVSGDEDEASTQNGYSTSSQGDFAFPARRSSPLPGRLTPAIQAESARTNAEMDDTGDISALHSTDADVSAADSAYTASEIDTEEEEDNDRSLGIAPQALASPVSRTKTSSGATPGVTADPRPASKVPSSGESSSGTLNSSNDMTEVKVDGTTLTRDETVRIQTKPVKTVEEVQEVDVGDQEVIPMPQVAPLPPRIREEEAFGVWGANFWVVIDQPNGDGFFANPETGRCAWAVPAGTIVLPPGRDGQWWELYDPTHHLPYYYHTRTRETRWERPTGTLVIPLAAIQETSLGKRFSRTEFGHESLAALATIPDNLAARVRAMEILEAAVPYRLRKQSIQSQRRASRLQPPPPAHSPTAARRRAYSSESTKSRNAPHESPTKRSSILASTSLYLEPGVHMTARRRGGALTPIRSVSELRLLDDALKPSNSTGGRPADASTLSSVEMPRPYRRERDPRKRRSAQITAGANGSSLAAPSGRKTPSPAKAMATGTTPRQRNASEPPAWGSPLITSHSGPISSDDASFERFAKHRFATHRTGPLRLRKVPVSKLMRWQKQPITAPLLELPDASLRKDAVRIFKVILRVFGDRETSVFWPKVPPPVQMSYGTMPKREGVHRSTSDGNMSATSETGRDGRQETPELVYNQGSPIVRIISPGSWHGGDPCSPGMSWGAGRTGAGGLASGPAVLEEERWLLERGILGGAALRDEIYAQVIKQLTENPRRESLHRGWQLLCVVVVCFPPSDDLYPHLRAFIDSHASHVTPVIHQGEWGRETEEEVPDPEAVVAIMARHCASRLDVIRARGPRGKAPTLSEIRCFADAAFIPSVFGQTLATVMARQQDVYPDARVPIILHFLVDAMLAMNAPNTYGIFRVPGDADLVAELRVRIERGHYSLHGLIEPEDNGQDVHVLAAVFKVFLRELEEALIPKSHYHRCLAASGSPARSIEECMQLPPLHLRVVVYVISFLQLFLDPETVQETGITAQTLALIFVPSFFRTDLDVDTTDALAVANSNNRKELRFLLNLLIHLPCQDLDRADDEALGGEARAARASASARYVSSGMRASQSMPQGGGSVGWMRRPPSASAALAASTSLPTVESSQDDGEVNSSAPTSPAISAFPTRPPRANGRLSQRSLSAQDLRSRIAAASPFNKLSSAQVSASSQQNDRRLFPGSAAA